MSELFNLPPPVKKVAAPAPVVSTDPPIGPSLLKVKTPLRLSHYELLSKTIGPTKFDDNIYRLLAKQILIAHPGWIKLWLETRGEEKEQVFMGTATTDGLKAARRWLQERPFRIAPQYTELYKLARNYNKFIKDQTEWETVTSQRFASICRTDPRFKERWAPKLTLPEIPTGNWYPNKRNEPKPAPNIKSANHEELLDVEVLQKGDSEPITAYFSEIEGKWLDEHGVNELYNVTHWRYKKGDER
jgi:hypothetical protein